MIEKRKDAQIFVLCHKKVDYDIPNNSLYTPLQCGSEINKENVCDLKDNTLINISEKNCYFLETTGTYWIWKNVCKNYKYVGQCQYRRQMIFPENMDFDDIFNNYDAISSTPLKFDTDIFTQYTTSHNIDDLKVIESIIKKDYPDYSDGMKQIFHNNNKLYYSAGCILKSDDFNNYCTFLFDILNKYTNKIKIYNNTDVIKYVTNNAINGKYRKKVSVDYQSRLCGYLAERIMTLYFKHNFENILEVKYTLMEDNIE